MRLLLDTHIVLAILRKDVGQRFPEIATLLGDSKTEGFVSVASLWETAIKARLGKLDPGMPLEDIARSLEEIGLILLRIEIQHVITAADPEPETRDPFDRLLLAQCKVEGLQLATVDRLLVDHPLALRL
ncbi:type II toxin-antitoxin system VapC family toxin [Rhizobium sophorae]|uniref:Type II toxin-antitoxin system VapC family toxin n=2 Tax=Rhizobium TaxID=379 RepID=A0ABR6A554_9HYPH|nr:MULTISPECIES: type II toxin-antitoxin system VapC family toxin [Rhizobium]MBX4859499.1 type II toxin-antitoxin system VapC family toxin [Rhizobium bangladeshense]NKK72320.1 PIN domain-containing protein [Rhizobium leguminosarum bv. viciae]MBA5801724.1 type II toxin-antitoxin system VapC family toxin [Rhizobium changzhiense]MCV9941707.1 type II toxin-antitoxin system VapC family toxin [Rhizobium sp. BT-175]MCW0016338.1 type II toxin-antitoxin system VapC family toxin [Rhizobium sp. BT-226]